MGKQRMTLLDVRAVVKELKQTLLGLRVSNIYNLNNRTFQFKFHAPQSVSKKMFVIMESGVRVHITKYEREKDKIPSSFVLKLRKHIRTKRLDDVRQMGTDRVIDFRFGNGENAFHVVLELYASGNVILTDHEYRILLVLRRHEYADADEDGESAKVAVREVYPVSLSVNDQLSFEPTKVRSSLTHAWKSYRRRKQEFDEKHTLLQSQFKSFEARHAQTGDGNKKSVKSERVKFQQRMSQLKKSKPKPPQLRSALAQGLNVGPEIITHALLSNDMNDRLPLDKMMQMKEPDQQDNDTADDKDGVVAFLDGGICGKLSEYISKGVADVFRQIDDPDKQQGVLVVRSKTMDKAGKNAILTKAQKKEQNKQRRKAQRDAEGVTVFADTSQSNQNNKQKEQQEQQIEEEEEEEKNKNGNECKEEEDKEEEKREQIEMYTEFLPLCLAQHNQARHGEYKQGTCEFRMMDR